MRSLRELTIACKNAGVEEIVGRSHVWSDFMIIRLAFQRNEIEAEWLDHRKSPYLSYNAPDMWVETAHEQCLNWKFCLKTWKLVVTMHSSGYDVYEQVCPVESKCKFSAIVTPAHTAFVEVLSRRAMSLLREKAQRAYDDEQNRRRQQAIDATVANYFCQSADEPPMFGD